MIYVYIVISAALIPVLNNFYGFLQKPNSWWLTPLLLIGFFVGFLIIHFAVFFGMLLLTNRSSNSEKSTLFFRFLMKDVLKVILFLARVEIDFKGIEKLPENHARMLFVCNHLHDYDPVVLLSCFPDSQLAFIGKKEIFETMPIVSKAMKRLQSLPIDRENDREAAKTIIKAIRLIKEDKASVCLFPEGYVSLSGELLPFRNGSLKIAIKSNCPIAVCVLKNTPSIFKNMFRRKTTVSFRLLDVIYPEQYEGMNTTQLGDIIHTKMETALKELEN